MRSSVRTTASDANNDDDSSASVSAGVDAVSAQHSNATVRDVSADYRHVSAANNTHAASSFMDGPNMDVSHSPGCLLRDLDATSRTSTSVISPLSAYTDVVAHQNKAQSSLQTRLQEQIELRKQRFSRVNSSSTNEHEHNISATSPDSLDAPYLHVYPHEPSQAEFEPTLSSGEETAPALQEQDTQQANEAIARKFVTIRRPEDKTVQ
jgi:hypothetical protein